MKRGVSPTQLKFLKAERTFDANPDIDTMSMRHPGSVRHKYNREIRWSMRSALKLLVLVGLCLGAEAQNDGISGVVVDPSRASVPGAVVRLRGHGRTKTDAASRLQTGPAGRLPRGAR